MAAGKVSSSNGMKIKRSGNGEVQHPTWRSEAIAVEKPRYSSARTLQVA
jgi:hypothetical protein